LIIKKAVLEEIEAITVLLQTYFLDTSNLDIENLYTARNTEHGQILGCIELSRHPLCELRLIAVHPNYRHRGIGTQLVRHALKKADTSMYLRTTAPRFFEKQGFKQLPPQARKKLWKDCAECDRFEECTQTAMFHPVNTSQNSDNPKRPQHLPTTSTK
jgi:amino-acid N-acetyltransferase